MKQIFFLAVVLLGSGTAFGQSYDKPPQLAFLMHEGKPTVALLSNDAHGVLEYGDTLSYKPYNDQVYQYVFTKNERVNIEELYESLYIPDAILNNVLLGGFEYIAINSTKYEYTSYQMGLQAEKAKKIFK